MTNDGLPFVMGVEEECLTLGSHIDMDRMFVAIQSLAPTLRACPSGIFTPLGRIYLDGSHLELASAEAGSPWILADIVARQQQLVAEAIQSVAGAGGSLEFANINYSGLLRSGACTWGTHENYLVNRPVSWFAEQMIPFLCSRFYAGSGAVHWPSGRYVASARVQFLAAETNGNTTRNRPLFCTARSDPGENGRELRRCHLVCADGHRSPINLALQFGATSLVLHALIERPKKLKSIPRPSGASKKLWLVCAKHFNFLAKPGEPLAVHPGAIQLQRFYLQLVSDWLAGSRAAPDWSDKIVALWQATLDAVEQGNHLWLSQRLDAWIKYDLLDVALEVMGSNWREAADNRLLSSHLTLISQDYHCFTKSDSIFQVLCEKEAILRSPRFLPVNDRWKIATKTRAAARAKMICEHAGETDLVLDWNGMINLQTGERWGLVDPMATRFELLPHASDFNLDRLRSQLSGVVD
ncbi:proteasome accessory factor PafA2 family protein [Adhaeretor mobilis]|uniref:Pup--protein ligase n=1 Tax=Adhaeretor mobilis TaxID=1930276 RepID=A0A517MQR1_9BACT|nr:proteasome accessory factor PafA2 family protein [Adhaeretor mobilis]QDS97214.1 Pup--protein ligase [Adhaeretor mobilis]